MHRRLIGASHVTAPIQAIANTFATHYMEPNYGSLLSYHLSSSGDYITFGNGDKEPIEDCVTKIVRLGVK